MAAINRPTGAAFVAPHWSPIIKTNSVTIGNTANPQLNKFNGIFIFFPFNIWQTTSSK